jgi:hypothetical protein
VQQTAAAQAVRQQLWEWFRFGRETLMAGATK